MDHLGAAPGLIEALGRIVGPQWVRHRAAELATCSADGLLTHESRPGLVVLPGSRDEVAWVPSRLPSRACRLMSRPYK